MSEEDLCVGGGGEGGRENEVESAYKSHKPNCDFTPRKQYYHV